MSDPLTVSLVFITGLILLGKGSDIFVEAAARIARILGVSELIIGLTLIAIGTSLPELGAGIVASSSGQTEIVLGNVVGSNIANIALILGLSAAIAPLLTEREMFYRDGYALLGISFIFYLFAYDGVVTAIEGIVLISLFFLYTSILLKFKPELLRIYRIREYVNFLYELDRVVDSRSYYRIVRNGINPRTYLLLLRRHLVQIRRLLHLGMRVLTLPIRLTDNARRAEYGTRARNYIDHLRKNIFYEFMLLLVSGLAIYIGAEFFVGGAVEIADLLGIGPSIVGLTIVSIGTSLPELATSLQSARKGFGSMVIGNLIGSNIANITLIIGVCSLIAPVSLGANAELQNLNISYIIPFMIFVTALGIVFIRRGWVVRRGEGIIFLLMYLGFILWLVSNPVILQ
jgi:cation:H+ antiporter